MTLRSRARSVHRALLFFSGAVLVALAHADSISEKRLELLFRPLLGERMAMSTDGHYLAYTQHVGTDLMVMVYDLERFKPLSRIIADEDRPIPFSKEKQRTELRFLEWANGHRLVFAPSIERAPAAMQAPSGDSLQGMSPEVREMISQIPRIPPKVIAPVMAVNADGTHPAHLFEDGAFQDALALASGALGRGVLAPRIHGFDTGKNRSRLLAEVNGGAPGVPTVLYRFDTETGAFSEVGSHLNAARVLLYDLSGQPRVKQLVQPHTGDISYEYRAPDQDRWVPMPDPPEIDAGAHFVPRVEDYYGPRVTALGFDFDPNVLIYASNADRDTFGIYGLDLRTRQRTSLALEVPHRDLVALDTTPSSRTLVFDKFQETFVGVRANYGPRPLTVWRDSLLASVQRAVERRFPQRSAQVLEWNEARTRFIVQTSGGTDPGRIYLVKRPEGSMTELMRRAPWLEDKDLHETEFFDFTTPEGVQLTGHLTLPRAPRINPPPLIIWFAPGLPPRPHPEFDPQAQVFADMGFVVCRLNQRGVLGLGAEHRDALRRDLDHAPGADAVAALEWIATHHRIDRKRVVVLGEGFAGHLALRATQVYPDTFRCAVVFDPIIHLASWVTPAPDSESKAMAGMPLPSFSQQINQLYLEGGGARLNQLPVTAHADQFNAATAIISSVNQRNPALLTGLVDLRAQLKRRDIPVLSLEYNDDYTLGLPGARARVYRELEEFFNLHLYHYDVRIGPTKVVK